MTVCLFIVLGSCKSGNSDNEAKPALVKVIYQWKQTEKSLALQDSSGRAIWQLNFDKAQDKPYFHPLRTPKGHNLTLERPKDHPWHRGLWFSWKDINGVNYWEEDTKKGLAEGRSIIKSINVEKHEDFSAKVILEISYEEIGEPMITEKRILTIGSPVNDEEYTIAWHQDFTFTEDVRLYLEKPGKHGGEEWGGYAGLSFRGSEELSRPRFIASSGWQNSADITGYGEKERWMDMTSQIAGADEYAGLTIYDSPSNPRYPSPYYIWFAKGENTFFTPSLLFDGPMDFKKRDTLTLDYLVLIHDGKRSVQQLESFIK